MDVADSRKTSSFIPFSTFEPERFPTFFAHHTKTRVCSVKQHVTVVLTLLLIVVFVSGCDTIEEPGTRPVLDHDVTLRFEIDQSAFEAGEELTVQSSNSIDLEGRLQGFSKGEIFSANITEVELELLSPPGTNLQPLVSSASVALTASGLNPVQVASDNSMPANFRKSLQSVTGSDVGSYLAASSFRGRLTLNAAGPASDDVVFLVHVSFRITFEAI